MSFTSKTTLAQPKARLFLVDDHPILREGLSRLLNREPDLEVCGQASDAAEALTAVTRVKPDLVVVDISLQGVSGIELIKEIKARHSHLPVLALSMHEEALYAGQALKAGALGYVMKQAPIGDVMAAIRSVLRREMYVSQKLRNRWLDNLPAEGAKPLQPSLASLNDREREVLRLIGQGRNTRQIAQRMHLSTKTIEAHRARLKEKLKLDNAAQLMHAAVRTADRSA